MVITWVLALGSRDSLLDDNNDISIVCSLWGLAPLALVLGKGSFRGLLAVVSLILGYLGATRAEEALAVGFLCRFLPTKGGGFSIFLLFEHAMVGTCE
jgi:hypothetical protein